MAHSRTVLACVVPDAEGVGPGLRWRPRRRRSAALPAHYRPPDMGRGHRRRDGSGAGPRSPCCLSFHARLLRSCSPLGAPSGRARRAVRHGHGRGVGDAGPTTPASGFAVGPVHFREPAASTGTPLVTPTPALAPFSLHPRPHPVRPAADHSVSVWFSSRARRRCPDGEVFRPTTLAVARSLLSLPVSVRSCRIHFSSFSQSRGRTCCLVRSRLTALSLTLARSHTCSVSPLVVKDASHPLRGVDLASTSV